MTKDWKTSTSSCLMNVSASSQKMFLLILTSHIHIKEPHQFDRTMTASERVKAGVRVKVVLNSHVSLNDAKSLCLFHQPLFVGFV